MTKTIKRNIVFGASIFFVTAVVALALTSPWGRDDVKAEPLTIIKATGSSKAPEPLPTIQAQLNPRKPLNNKEQSPPVASEQVEPAVLKMPAPPTLHDVLEDLSVEKLLETPFFKRVMDNCHVTPDSRLVYELEQLLVKERAKGQEARNVYYKEVGKIAREAVTNGWPLDHPGYQGKMVYADVTTLKRGSFRVAIRDIDFPGPFAQIEMLALWRDSTIATMVKIIQSRSNP